MGEGRADVGQRDRHAMNFSDLAVPRCVPSSCLRPSTRDQQRLDRFSTLRFWQAIPVVLEYVSSL